MMNNFLTALIKNDKCCYILPESQVMYIQKMKRDILRQFRFNKKENDTLKMKSAKCGITDSALVRLLVLGFHPKEKPDKAFYDVMRNLSSMTNSLNQVAAKANSLDFVDVPLLMKAIGNIEKMQDDLHKYFIKPDRDTHLWQ